MVNQKRGLLDSVSCSTTEIPEHRIIYRKSGAKEKHQLNPVEQSNRQEAPT